MLSLSNGCPKDLVLSRNPPPQAQEPLLGQSGQTFLREIKKERKEKKNARLIRVSVIRAREMSPPRAACAEAEVEAALVSQVRAAGGVCWKFTSPGTQGVPDRVVILPGGRIGFVELKRTGALPRPIQVRRIAQLAALGVPVFVCDHTDQIEGVLDAIRAA